MKNKSQSRPNNANAEKPLMIKDSFLGAMKKVATTKVKKKNITAQKQVDQDKPL